jgi:hypothetical protein
MAYDEVTNTTQPDRDKRERRKADKSYRITADSLREIRRGMTKETDRLSDDLGMDWEGGVEGATKTLKPAHLINALATWFLGRPEAERTAILQEGLALYIARLDGLTAAPFASIPRGEPRVKGTRGYSKTDHTGDTQTSENEGTSIHKKR